MRIKLWKRPRPEPVVNVMRVLKVVEQKHDTPQHDGEYEDYSTDIRPIVLAKRR